MAQTIPLPISDEASRNKAQDVALEQVRLHKGMLHVVSVLPDFGMSMVGAHCRKEYERDALRGSIYDEFLRAADKSGDELIVIGSARPELKDYLLGRNAARVEHHARQSTYVARI